MSITANDPFSETAADLAKSEAQASQPGAAGAELPVTVHASRYSAASKGAAKLPPIHEETRTVIIFPQGAVVRLSAAVTPGELVVLTNKRTGSDVICRVTNVKAQPGIQNYVHLEFTQRALDFWQEPAAAPQNPSARTAARSNPVGTATPSPATLAGARPVQPTQEAEPVAKPSAPTLEVKSAPAALPKITSLADGVAADPKQNPKPPASTPRLLEARSAETPAIRPPVVPSSRPQLQPFEASIPRKSTSKVVVFAVAAVVLLAVCGVTATILLRQNRGTAATLTASDSSGAATPEPSRTPSATATDTPASHASSRSNDAAPPVTALKNASVDISAPQLAPVREVAEPSKMVITDAPKADVESQPASHPSPRATLNVGKIEAPKTKTASRGNVPEPPPVLTADANTLPGVVTENLNVPAHIDAVAPPQPAAPSPVKGGQLQQPKLLSSAPAAYPALARSQRIQGDVTIDALIDAKGEVASMKVLNGNALLQSAATDALRRWKYHPATLDGQPIPIHINVTISFKLN